MSKSKVCVESGCGLPIEYKRAMWWHVDPEAVDDPHPALRWPPPPPRCIADETIGSYPGEAYVKCELSPGHEGEHEARVYWS